ncbi:MAG: 30S ribosome-binding factor RbfA [Chloroflexota bacterium]
MTRRAERVGHLIRQEISELLRSQVKDPRLGSLIAINDVVISADLKYAKIFVSHVGSPEERQGTLAALAAAAGFLRRQLARNLRLRHIPELDFRWDDSIERGARILELIDRVCPSRPPDPDQG